MMDITKMIELIEKEGGMTLWADETFSPKAGYVVGRSDYVSSVKVDPAHVTALRFALADAQRRTEMAQAIAKDHGSGVQFALGVWFDGEKVWIDLSQYVSTRLQAHCLADQLGEISYWDIAKNEEVRVV